MMQNIFIFENGSDTQFIKQQHKTKCLAFEIKLPF